MGARLTKQGDVFAVKLMGMGDMEFQHALMQLRQIPGKRFNRETKCHEFPDDPDSLMRIVNSIQPDLDSEVKALVQRAQHQIADELVSRIGEDAELPQIAWADELYPFQRAGAKQAAEWGKALICDEMGLGKTIQSITATALVIQPGQPQLVISPNTGSRKWAREYPKWIDDLPAEPVVLDGKTEKKRAKQIDTAASADGTLVMNWEKLRIASVHAALQNITWGAIIADEAHRMKNRNAQQTQALAGAGNHKETRKTTGLRAPLQFALTGTPIMTQPDDLWTLLNWFDADEYSSYWRFFNQYTEAYKGYKGYVVVGVKNPEGLRFELTNKLIRRTKKQVGIQLPPDSREFREIPMKPAQEKMYRRAEREFLFQIETAREDTGFDFEALERAIATQDTMTIDRLVDGGGQRFNLLRQIAVSPALIGEKDESGLLDAITETITDNPGKQFVVWGWHQATVELIAHRLRKQKPSISTEAVHGEVNEKRRDELIERFQAGGMQVICLTIGVGKENIDLFAADTALFAERSGVAVTNEQAEGRISRIGQVHPTTQIVFASENTVQAGRLRELERLREGIGTAVMGKA
jgi:SWI/SNF-related matrix-associated actin-dependent regulator 1 of chromatin subfamily A